MSTACGFRHVSLWLFRLGCLLLLAAADPQYCNCIDITCTPLLGSNANQEIHYPGDGSMWNANENQYWCFTDDSCGTAQKGNRHTCNRVKFVFGNCHKPTSSPDATPFCAVFISTTTTTSKTTTVTTTSFTASTITLTTTATSVTATTSKTSTTSSLTGSSTSATATATATTSKTATISSFTASSTSATTTATPTTSKTTTTRSLTASITSDTTTTTPTTSNTLTTSSLTASSTSDTTTATPTTSKTLTTSSCTASSTSVTATATSISATSTSKTATTSSLTASSTSDTTTATPTTPKTSTTSSFAASSTLVTATATSISATTTSKTSTTSSFTASGTSVTATATSASVTTTSKIATTSSVTSSTTSVTTSATPVSASTTSKTTTTTSLTASTTSATVSTSSKTETTSSRTAGITPVTATATSVTATTTSKTASTSLLTARTTSSKTSTILDAAPLDQEMLQATSEVENTSSNTTMTIAMTIRTTTTTIAAMATITTATSTTNIARKTTTISTRSTTATRTLGTTTATIVATTSTNTVAALVLDAAPPNPETLQAVSEVEEGLFDQLLEGNRTAVTVEIEGAIGVAQHVSTSNTSLPSSHITVPAGGTGAAVALPSSLVEGLGSSVIVLITAFDDTWTPNATAENQPDKGGSQENQALVKGLVSIKVALPDSTVTKIEGLENPIIVDLPANATDGVECAFWDDSLNAWSSAGLVKVGGTPQSPLKCASSHLTIFAAIWRGVEKTIVQCSQASLLSEEGFKTILENNWYSNSAIFLLWSFLFITLLLLVVALCLERRRRRKGFRDDGLFFMIFALPAASDFEIAEEADEASDFDAIQEAVPAGCCTRCCASICYCMRKIAQCIWFVLDPLLQEIVGSLGDLHSAAVDLISGVRELFIHDGEGLTVKGCFALLSAGLARSVLSSVHLQTATMLHMRADDVMYFTSLVSDVEGNRKIAPVCASTAERLKEGASVSGRHLERIAFLRDLKQSLHSARRDVFAQSGFCRYLPKSLWRMFVSKNPWLSALQYSVFRSSTMEVMLLIVLIVGDSAVSAFFHSPSGTVSKRSRGVVQADCNIQGWWEESGRILIISAAAAFCATMPCIFLGRFHKRKFIDYRDESSWSWRWQRWRWRTGDLQLWIIGLMYSLFSCTYCLVFLVNVSEKDQMAWMISVLLTFGLQVLIVPLFVALVLLILTFIGLRLKSVKELCADALVDASDTVDVNGKEPEEEPEGEVQDAGDEEERRCRELQLVEDLPSPRSSSTVETKEIAEFRQIDAEPKDLVQSPWSSGTVQTKELAESRHDVTDRKDLLQGKGLGGQVVVHVQIVGQDDGEFDSDSLRSELV
eukprot:TRINITY_DN6419_c0_g1_i3.p1 TRINITY_DN6419_c0_g1~~TRINITY_DN6419_c0_g1_i3.p1  ORF type:complete len:1340 (+),score=153.07 TRINITY_DN6419_c0_g1_i3:106-4125(+)